MTTQKLSTPPSRSAIAALRQIVDECGIYWTLTTLATIVREDLDSITAGQIPERLAHNIEKARDA